MNKLTVAWYGLIWLVLAAAIRQVHELFDLPGDDPWLYSMLFAAAGTALKGWFDREDERRFQRLVVAVRLLRLSSPGGLSVPRSLDHVRDTDDLAMAVMLDGDGRLANYVGDLSRDQVNGEMQMWGAVPSDHARYEALAATDRAILQAAHRFVGIEPVDLLLRVRRIILSEMDAAWAGSRDGRAFATAWLERTANACHADSAIRRLMQVAAANVQLTNKPMHMGTWSDFRAWLRTERPVTLDDLMAESGPPAPKVEIPEALRNVLRADRDAAANRRRDWDAIRANKVPQMPVIQGADDFAALVPSEWACVRPELTNVLERWRDEAARLLKAPEQDGEHVVDISAYLLGLESLSNASGGPILATRNARGGDACYEFDGVPDRLRADLTLSGVICAYYAAVILPTVGAQWHGLYGRDYQLLRDEDEAYTTLSQARNFDFGAPALETVAATPSGLRMRRTEEGAVEAVWMTDSVTEGVMDRGVRVSADGAIELLPARTLYKPDIRVLY